MAEDRDGGHGAGEPSPILAPLGLVARRMTAMIEREAGMGAGQWFTLTALERSDGMGQAEISRMAEVDHAVVTRMGQALEREGYVRRERDPEDKRVVRVYLTEKGRRALKRRPEINERVRSRIGRVLGEEEVEDVRRKLVLLAEAMQE